MSRSTNVKRDKAHALFHHFIMADALSKSTRQRLIVHFKQNVNITKCMHSQ